MSLAEILAELASCEALLPATTHLLDFVHFWSRILWDLPQRRPLFSTPHCRRRSDAFGLTSATTFLDFWLEEAAQSYP
jgi:hypothetical protein